MKASKMFYLFLVLLPLMLIFSMSCSDNSSEMDKLGLKDTLDVESNSAELGQLGWIKSIRFDVGLRVFSLEKYKDRIEGKIENVRDETIYDVLVWVYYQDTICSNHSSPRSLYPGEVAEWVVHFDYLHECEQSSLNIMVDYDEQTSKDGEKTTSPTIREEKEDDEPEISDFEREQIIIDDLRAKYENEIMDGHLASLLEKYPIVLDNKYCIVIEDKLWATPYINYKYKSKEEGEITYSVVADGIYAAQIHLENASGLFSKYTIVSSGVSGQRLTPKAFNKDKTIEELQSAKSDLERQQKDTLFYKGISTRAEETEGLAEEDIKSILNMFDDYYQELSSLINVIDSILADLKLLS
jgi:hypothetical protein